MSGLCGNNCGTVENSFWDNETSGLLLSGCGTANNTAGMTDMSNYVGWDFSGIWKRINGINDGQR